MAIYRPAEEIQQLAKELDALRFCPNPSTYDLELAGVCVEDRNEIWWAMREAGHKVMKKLRSQRKAKIKRRLDKIG